MALVNPQNLAMQDINSMDPNVLAQLVKTQTNSPTLMAKLGGKNISINPDHPLLKGVTNLALGAGLGLMTGNPMFALGMGALKGIEGFQNANIANNNYKAALSQNINQHNVLNNALHTQFPSLNIPFSSNPEDYKNFVENILPIYQDSSTQKNMQALGGDLLKNNKLDLNKVNEYMKSTELKDFIDKKYNADNAAINRGDFATTAKGLTTIEQLMNSGNKNKKINNSKNINFQSNNPLLKGTTPLEDWDRQDYVNSLQLSPSYNTEAMQKTIDQNKPFQKEDNSKTMKFSDVLRKSLLNKTISEDDYNKQISDPYYNPNEEIPMSLAKSYMTGETPLKIAKMKTEGTRQQVNIHAANKPYYNPNPNSSSNPNSQRGKDKVLKNNIINQFETVKSLYGQTNPQTGRKIDNDYIQRYKVHLLQKHPNLLNANELHFRAHRSYDNE